MKPEKETKEERFKRVAEARVNKILNMVRLLGNCSNELVYKYTEEQVDKIFYFVEKEVKEAKLRFKTKCRKNDEKSFKLIEEKEEKKEG